MSERKSWTDVEEQDKIFNFRDTNVLSLGFLDNGKDIYDKEITLKDGSKRTIKHSVEFKVIDLFTSEKGIFNANSVRLMKCLSSISNKKPEGKKIKIERIIGRTDFDNTYKCSLIKEK